MKKTPSLFLRDFSRPGNPLTREVNPDAAWVVAGEGVATRKWDGVCVMFDGQQWWARREVKAGKSTPEGFVHLGDDPSTGKVMGWEPAENSGRATLIAEAAAHQRETPAGTYELCGPKVNGNPDGLTFHTLIRHEAAEERYVPRDYDGLRDSLSASTEEGLVWHHPDGRMAKLKRSDFRGADA